MRARTRMLLVAGALLLGGPFGGASPARADVLPAKAPGFVVAGRFCAPRSGSPAASAAGFGLAALGIALIARRRGGRGRPGVGSPD